MLNRRAESEFIAMCNSRRLESLTRALKVRNNDKRRAATRAEKINARKRDAQSLHLIAFCTNRIE